MEGSRPGSARGGAPPPAKSLPDRTKKWKMLGKRLTPISNLVVSVSRVSTDVLTMLKSQTRALSAQKEEEEGLTTST